MKLEQEPISLQWTCDLLRARATYLLIANSKLALRLLTRLCKCLELLDGLSLGHMETELDICLGVLMARLEDVVVSRDSGKLEGEVSDVHRPWYHQAGQPMSGSKPYASLRHYPRRIGRIL